MQMEYWLPVIWFGVIGFGVLMYVLLDGFVLGLGILAPFAEDEHQLDHMMNTAAPIWDGNETWLVLGGAGLLAAFPKAYALILSSLVIYASVYAFVFGAGIWYLQKLLRKGPVPQPPKDTDGGEKTPARPMSLPDEKVDE